MAQKKLGKWQDDDNIPDAVKQAADAYDAAYTKKAKALGVMNSAKEKVIDLMKEHNVKSVPIRSGAKRLVLEDGYSVKITKPQSQNEAADVE